MVPPVLMKSTATAVFVLQDMQEPAVRSVSETFGHSLLTFRQSFDLIDVLSIFLVLQHM